MPSALLAPVRSRVTTRVLARVATRVASRATPPVSPVAVSAAGDGHFRPDVDAAAVRYARLATVFAGARVHYAVSADPHPDLIRRLVANGARFAVTGPAEVDACVAAGADGSDLLYSHPVMTSRDLASSGQSGVRTFVVDSEAELVEVARRCPDADVLCRLVTLDHGSDRPSSHRRGVGADQCVQLLRNAKKLGLGVAGVAFHVGSWQQQPGRWREPIRQSAEVFARLRGHRIDPWLLDLGDGFPAAHARGFPPLATYASVIEEAMDDNFGPWHPQLVVEPGRAVAGISAASSMAGGTDRR